MAGKHFRNAGALVALAVGLATAALPAAANAQDGERHGGWQRNGGGERGGERGNNGGGWQRQQQQQAPQVQQQAPPQVQQAPRMEQRGTAPFSDWRAPGRDGQRGEGQRGEGRRGEGQQAGRDWNNGSAGNRTGEPARQAPPQVQREERQRTYADVWRNRSYQSRQQGGEGSYERNRDGDRRWDGDRRDGDRRWEGNRTGGNWNRGNWNRDWRRDNRYDWSSWRNHHRDTFRVGRYYAPYRGWSYRRLGIGFFLQPLFFSQNYWIDDPWMYRLPEPYGPYRWVRYYDDALLVNIYNGEVVDVIYDFFW